LKTIFNGSYFILENYNYLSFPLKLFLIEGNIILGIIKNSRACFFIFDENKNLWKEYLSLPFDSLNLNVCKKSSSLYFIETKNLIESPKLFIYDVAMRNWTIQTLMFTGESNLLEHINDRKNVFLFFLSNSKMILYNYKSSQYFMIDLKKLEINLNLINSLQNYPNEDCYQAIYKGMIEEWNKELFVIIFFSNNQKISYLLKKIK
jgi:hypothetical protein